MTLPSSDVVRSAKQVYNHLDLRERIPNLSSHVKDLPTEIQKMQTLWLTDKNELAKVIRSFLQWVPPKGTKKSLEHLTTRLESAISLFCILPDEDDDIAADAIDIDNFSNNTETTSAKRPSSSTTQSNVYKRARSDSLNTSSGAYAAGRRLSISPQLITPPLSPPSESERASNTTDDVNILYNPPRGIKPYEGISWTIQFEIARFLSTFQLNDIPFEVLQRFLDVAMTNPRNLFETMMAWYLDKIGSRKSASVMGLMERCSECVWSHLEKNTENRMIHYHAVIALPLGKPPTIELRPPRVGASNRFFRKYGDHRFLELKLNRTTHVSQIRRSKDYFLKPFILMGRTFRFLFVKDDTIILFATEGAECEPVSIRQVIDWHIPILDNWNMTTSKFASRMSLGYSNSIPTLVFDPSNIHYVDDLYSGSGGDEETCMTDGCGLISVSAMRRIMGCEHADTLPCAVQGRIGGAKGIWLVAPDLDFGSGEWIQIRKSQHKFKTGTLQYDMKVDPLHYTFDLVKNAICIYPSSLNTQFIQCLSSGGVPNNVFLELLSEYLDRLTSVVADNHNIRVLRDWIAKTGSVMNMRWEMENAERSVWRERSNSEYDDELEIISHEDELAESIAHQSKGERWKMNQYSGSPIALHESTIRLIDSGFDLSNPHLASKVTNVFRDVMRSVVTKYKIEVQQSCTITCVPDPTGVLEEGEVFLQLSNRRVDEVTGITAGLVTGAMIVGRNPCGLKSDIQKVTAVDRPELRIYTDVIVFPTKGARSLASMLAGGDYDGDIIFCCWDQRIVESFVPSPVPKEPSSVKVAFDINTTRMRENLAKARDDIAKERALQTSFINVSLPDGTLGVYENWRTVLAESLPMDHPDVVYLAIMCAKLVDAPKQGYSLKPSIYKRDKNNFGKIPHPPWFLDKKNQQRERDFRSYQEVNKDVQPREKILGTAMDHLHDALLKKTEAYTKYTRSMFDEKDIKLKDPDLALPWEQAVEMAKQLGDEMFSADLERIRTEIDASLDNYSRDFKDLVFRRQQKIDSRYDPTRPTEPFLAEHSCYNTAFELEEHFAKQFLEKIPSKVTSTILKIDEAVHNGQLLKTIKASYAYLRSIQREKYSKYCYIVAFDTIRRIKADSKAKAAKNNGICESIAPNMYSVMTMERRWIRKLKESRSVADTNAALVRLRTIMNDEEK
ncbi:RNA dependent RNA polymerase-domain-containing protein [Dichotomocladium elegans]|nr:RNA dependent RNA polymerase-domain-containing protein [Dichotomocladium elegans]